MKGSGSQVGRGAARCMEHSPAQVRDLLQGYGAFVFPLGISIPVSVVSGATEVALASLSPLLLCTRASALIDKQSFPCLLY